MYCQANKICTKQQDNTHVIMCYD